MRFYLETYNPITKKWDIIRRHEKLLAATSDGRMTIKRAEWRVYDAMNNLVAADYKDFLETED